MNIVIFGNMNNYPYLLAKGFRTIGCKVNLVVPHRERLHRPEYVNGMDRYPEWTYDVSDLGEDDFIKGGRSISKIIRFLEGGDALLLNHYGPSLLEYVDRPAIALLTGSDLDYYANLSTVKVREATHDSEYRRTSQAAKERNKLRAFINRQRRGIRKATAVSYFPRGIVPAGDRLLEEIGVKDEKRFFVYMADIDGVQYVPPPSNRVPRIFCGTRVTWKKPIKPGESELDYKGTDVFIEGLAMFLKRTALKIEVRMVEKGWHVAESRELAANSGIANLITWLPEMPRYEFDKELEHADICVEQLGTSCIGMAGLDAMARGRPLIANARHEEFRNHFPEPMPVCDATTAAEVCEQLDRLVSDKQLREEIGLRSRDFVVKYCSPQANAEKCLQRFKTENGTTIWSRGLSRLAKLLSPGNL